MCESLSSGPFERSNLLLRCNGSIRRNALAKLAALSTTPSTLAHTNDIGRLTGSLLRPKSKANGFLDGMLRSIAPTSRLPMHLRELDVLLALCKAAPGLHNLQHAETLVSQLKEYLPEAHTQVFHPSPFLHDIKPSPWEALTFHLSHALLVLGLRFPELQLDVSASIQAYISNCIRSLKAISSIAYEDHAKSQHDEEQDAAEIASITVSLKGFMEAAALNAHYWPSLERVEIVRQLQGMLSDQFLVAVETASSTIRTSSHSDHQYRDWRKYLRRYAAHGTPLGAMLLQQGFMRFVLACTSRLLANEVAAGSGGLLEQYLSGQHFDRAEDEDIESSVIEYLTEVIADEIRVLEEGSDYLQLTSAWQQRLAFSVKAFALEAFLHCMMVDEDIADADILFDWLEDSLSNEVQMADENLASIVLKSFAVLAKSMPESASNFARLLLRFIVQGTSMRPIVAIAAESLAHVLQILSQDAVITTLYSLGNVLSSSSGTEKTQNASTSTDVNGLKHHHSGSLARVRTGSVISLSMSGEEETSVVCGNVAHAIAMVANNCNDSRITALAQSLMLQKVGKINQVVDARILEESATLATTGKETEFRALLRFYSRLNNEALQNRNLIIVEAIQNARVHLAANLDNQSPLFRIFAVHLLERIVTKGDVVEGDTKRVPNIEQAAEEIAPLLKPLALLVSRKPADKTDGSFDDDDELLAMAREAWFNIAVHGITLQSKLGLQYYHELRVLAMNSQPLVDEDRAELLEGDVELNTILRRSMTPQHTTEQKKNLISILPNRESEIRHLSYPKVVFLNAAFIVESLRARSGNCSEVLKYFLDPAMKNSGMGMCMSGIAQEVITIYLNRALPGDHEEFGSAYVSRQLAQILTGCCHRIAMVQQVARACADRMIAQVPSALCHKSALFALLEILTTMWSACLDAEIDEYGFKSTFTSTRRKITLELSDDYTFRKRTLNTLYTEARKWVIAVLAVAPLDVKGLLQTYLSEYDDTGAYGHVSLGRSFALEMGSLIPPSDQRLRAIDRQAEHVNVNVASDLMAQYTTRQEYRHADVAGVDRDMLRLMSVNDQMANARLEPSGVDVELQKLLDDIQHRIYDGGHIQISDMKDVLRRAAALLCRSKGPQCAIVHHLVNIPFQAFTKTSIKLGISLWLGVIHENPRMEPRILTEIALAWEKTINCGVGIFSDHFHHQDPFYVKMEFAPSDKEALLKHQQLVQDTISPHLRVHQFFESHFNAIRLGSLNTQRTFIRVISKTLDGFRKISCHPLAREIHFHVVLLALQMLRFNTCLSKNSCWRLKDQILCAGLHWFSAPPVWSFGGNRLQIKAEVNIMADVLAALKVTEQIGLTASKTRKSLQSKQDLLQLLIESERTRLLVWLFPLEHEPNHQGVRESALIPMIRTAWSIEPSIAIQLATRFPSEPLRQAIRFLLLNFPEKATGEADALEILLGPSLPSDVSFQLKYLLYWAPVNPMQAVTYFLPAYGNHPFILQYGMQALDHHLVDITFFYVPQIVQGLRYDALGYVERYIVEAGNFSQLFAHQIIWNMKANAYKDEDSQVPDSVKPTLDKVMNSLISSFSAEDRDFYEREFRFFNEVTSISGKLKPYIKKSKPEKKAKIEEELRKVKVEVGVYLPSNPDGVVFGIDRKSGKPLQSHAKAPFMATFRIRKSRERPVDEMSSLVEEATQDQRPKRGKNASAGSASDLSLIGSSTNAETYEVWQSAIFKVGDDCRQDVLALQMIAAFRGIFNSCGLDVYVYPYRVTATAPGCGVIDVLPNSISRDMLGREAVNGLYDYFVTKYGGEDSVRFQEARANFVKSMAAYSVISYLLQFKDRHNGNIMVDDAGHILHIDFGFCFDIAPGGVKFERAPFKLTPEMMAVMGKESSNGQPYRWFEELTVKAFLASRPYTEKLSHLVALMLDSGLPCFKPESMKNFKDRFVLDRTEREAADFMKACIRKSEGNYSTKVYDEFQLLTNGIPY
jgi:phosphatidylinositol 4-kinase A